MDTRSKIQTPDQIIAELSQGLWTLAVGRFPALTAEHVEVLQKAAEADGLLTVAVAADDWGGPYPLDASSRAQLVAAVEGVDLVVICDQSAVERLRKLGKPSTVIEIEKRVQRDIVADVIARHSQKPA